MDVLFAEIKECGVLSPLRLGEATSVWEVAVVFPVSLMQMWDKTHSPKSFMWVQARQIYLGLLLTESTLVLWAQCCNLVVHRSHCNSDTKGSHFSPRIQCESAQAPLQTSPLNLIFQEWLLNFRCASMLGLLNFRCVLCLDIALFKMWMTPRSHPSARARRFQQPSEVYFWCKLLLRCKIFGNLFWT